MVITCASDRDDGEYSYQSLESQTSIRILELLPGKIEDTIRCHLSIYKREDAPSYEALSYAWGNPDDKSQVNCHGRTVKVPTSLFDFLKRLRGASDVRRLWADAICIDQSNTKEVGHQVRQMGPIYSEAERVLIWLGSQDYFEEFDQEVQTLSLFRTFWEMLDDGRPWDPSESPFNRHKFALALRNLFNHDWFYRLWIIQEVGLAKSKLALFGNRKIDFNKLMSLARKLVDRKSGIAHQYNIGTWFAMSGTYNLFPNNVSTPVSDWALSLDFLDVLQITRMSQASDPRDYVFALLGHPSARINGTFVIEPDYTRTSWDIFHELAVKILRYDNRLRLLAAVRHCNQEVLSGNYPSWVPVWDRKPYLNFMGTLSIFHLNDASAGFSVSYCLVNEGKTLQVSGFTFDTVEECTEEMRLSFTANYFSGIKPWPIDTALAFRALSGIPIEEKLHDMFLTLTNSSESQKTFKASYEDFASFRVRLARQSAELDNIDRSGLIPEGLEAALNAEGKWGDSSQFAAKCDALNAGKCLFATEGGLLGKGPAVLRPGDVCCILYGGTVPFILRPVGSQYRLVGAAYIRKAMQGEVMVDMMVGEKYQDKVFDIF